MPLAPGTRLGTYEVGSQIGVGGMGEVYRATDTRLGRPVAIKVLPAAVAQDAERLARFDREARTLALLNHPHIAQIYGVEEADGVKGLVMELVDGPTLADHVARGPMPPADALPIATQIAEALETAHEQGIVHRDLKPANVKVRPDGTVKVLDFGLAKALDPVGASSSGQTMLATITSPAMTQLGLILGTAAYMSPEQARGRTVDKRTDIWAFGCVLFEMLSGVRTFEGDDVAAVLGAVIHKDVDWTRLPATTPPAVRSVLKACLEKDARQRIRDMGDVRLALAGVFGAPSAIDDAASPRPATSRRTVVMVGAAAALLAGTLGAAAAWFVRSPPLSETVAFTVDTPPTGNPSSFALSPDGRHLAFTGADKGVQMLWVRDLASIAARMVPGTEQATGPFWSPDSRNIAFFSGSVLKQVPFDGGAPRTIAQTSTTVLQGGTWSRDGVILFSRFGAEGIMRVPAAGGDSRLETHRRGDEDNHTRPEFLPDGRHFLYVQLRQDGAPQLVWRALDSTEERVVAEGQGGWYSPTGHLVYYAAADGQVLARRFDPTTGTVSGETIPVLGRIWSATLNRAALSVSPAGVLAYRGADANTGIAQLSWVDRRGAVRSTIGAPGAYRNLDLDAAGERIVVNAGSDGEDLWLFEPRRGTTSRLTFAPLPDSDAVFSPDGNRIAFYSARTPPGIYVKPTTGAASEELVAETGYQGWPRDWSSDGRYVLYQKIRDLWVLPMEGERTPFPFLNTAAQEQDGRFSPDTKWIAYASDESGRFEVYVQDFPARKAKFLVSTAGGTEPRWRRDGRELFYLAPDGRLMSVAVNTSPSVTLGVPAPLFQTSVLVLPVPAQRRFEVRADGQQFLMNIPVAGAAAIAPLTVIVNWQRVLEGR